MKKLVTIVMALAAAVSCGTSSRVPADSTTDDTVNIGYGTQSRRDSNYAIGSVKVDESQIASYESITEYLKARVPGIEVLDNGSVRVRGENSLSLRTEALILVDEVEVKDLLTVNPVEVHSVDVLKDAAASAYGVKGANGVVLITTKAAYQAQKAEQEARKAQHKAARQARKDRK